MYHLNFSLDKSIKLIRQMLCQEKLKEIADMMENNIQHDPTNQTTYVKYD